MTDRLPQVIPHIGDDGSIPLQSRSPNPASVEAQTPDVGPERGSAVTGGGRR